MSGNPRGRTKGSKNVKTILTNRLNDRVKTNVNGKITTETVLEAIVRGQVYEALTKRELKRAAFLLGQIERLRIFDETESHAPGSTSDAVEESDAEIVRRLMDRLMGGEDGR